ncbi:hypothetical protein O181_116280 [Austropuccinia psidii MF-1]|uniref:Uncharacterized protein n=1 Tax=Austropuccinia psidii MF-1 TaxID=1389203 RepID=A0A9Q3KC31_9BASI|nr:hypothetical protein [Austropuccinia psidii MF-1]
MRPKRAKGGNHLAPKDRWVPNHKWPPIPWTQNWPKDLLDTNLVINPVGPIFGHGPPWTILPAMASGNHQRQPDQLSKHFPQLKGNSFIPPCTPYPRLQEWCIYGIIYYYAPFLLSNSMVTFSGPNSTIPNQGPKIQHPFSKEDYLTHQSGNPWRQSEDHSRSPTTWPCRSWVGNFIQNYFKGILRGYTVFQSVAKATSISITLGQPN